MTPPPTGRTAPCQQVVVGTMNDVSATTKMTMMNPRVVLVAISNSSAENTCREMIVAVEINKLAIISGVCLWH